MGSGVDRLLAIERALDDVQFAERLLGHPIDVQTWQGPARRAFDDAWNRLPVLVRSAEAALERERDRAVRLAGRG